MLLFSFRLAKRAQNNSTAHCKTGYCGQGEHLPGLNAPMQTLREQCAHGKDNSNHIQPEWRMDLALPFLILELQLQQHGRRADGGHNHHR